MDVYLKSISSNKVKYGFMLLRGEAYLQMVIKTLSWWNIFLLYLIFARVLDLFMMIYHGGLLD